MKIQKTKTELIDMKTLKWGDIVKLTKRGKVTLFPKKSITKGVFLGYVKSKYDSNIYLSIVPEGYKNASIYSSSFWKII